MTNNEINQTIAEHCGWAPCHKGCDGRTWRKPDDSGCQEHLPDYCVDLNAMNYAESHLMQVGGDDVFLYYDNINDVLAKHAGYDACLYQASASARVRAEAFLRTIGKWRDQ